MGRGHLGKFPAALQRLPIGRQGNWVQGLPCTTIHTFISYLMIEVKRFNFSDKELAQKAFAIRRKVFVEEEGVDPALEYDNNEETAHHYLLIIAEKPLATARWRETDKGIKLERFAVLPEFRNRGFGEIVLKAVLEDVIPTGKRIYLHSQLRAVPFYERNGFVKEGPVFYEANMGHYFMNYFGNIGIPLL